MSCVTSAITVAVFGAPKREVHMSINEMMESPTKARKKLGRHAQVVRYDDGSAGSLLNVMHIESTSVQRL